MNEELGLNINQV